MSNGKGDTPRPLSVSKDEFDAAWARTFGEPPKFRPAATAEPVRYSPTNESVEAHEWRYDQKLTPEMREKIARPAATSGEDAETLLRRALGNAMRLLERRSSNDVTLRDSVGTLASAIYADVEAALTAQATEMAALREALEAAQHALQTLGSPTQMEMASPEYEKRARIDFAQRAADAARAPGTGGDDGERRGHRGRAATTAWSR